MEENTPPQTQYERLRQKAKKKQSESTDTLPDTPIEKLSSWWKRKKDGTSTSQPSTTTPQGKTTTEIWEPTIFVDKERDQGDIDSTQSHSVPLLKKYRSSPKKKIMAILVSLAMMGGLGVGIYHTQNNGAPDGNTEATVAHDKEDSIPLGDADADEIVIDDKTPQGKIRSNEFIYPNPPNPASDLLSPADVNIPQTPLNLATISAVGDSTVALGDGAWVDGPTMPCHIDRETWAEKIGASNHGCSGKTTSQIVDLLNQHPDSIADATTVFVTAGSNDARSNQYNKMDKGMESIVSTIKKINSDAAIVFVGYLPVFIYNKCMDMAKENAARRLHHFHTIANHSMMDSAIRNNLTYIDMSQAAYNICSSQSFVRLPHTTRGVDWHTTPAGHDYIAGRIKTVLKMGATLPAPRPQETVRTGPPLPPVADEQLPER